MLSDEPLELLRRGALLRHRVADVGPVEPGGEDRRGLDVQPSAHVLASLVVGGRRERHERDAGEEIAQLSQLDVLRPEVVAPLADAVRLVDREQGDLHRPKRREEARHHEALGRDIQHAEAPRPQFPQDVRGVAR